VLLVQVQLGYIKSIDSGYIIKLSDKGEVDTFGGSSNRVTLQALQVTFSQTQLVRNLDTGQYEDTAAGEIPGWATAAFLAA
jgi:hypothetical protein